MPASPEPLISSRKRPRQARSAALVEAVLQAATQVLERVGASRFTTARVAERAGISIGSLYQYFPNKAAILFRLQHDEWQETSRRLLGILEDTGAPPPERLRQLVRVFLHSECEEAEMRTALAEAAPLYNTTPEARQARRAAANKVRIFLREALPDTPEVIRERAGRLMGETMATMGKRFSERPRAPADIDAYAADMADMFCAYLGSLRERRSG